ncbi:LANO_0G09692g1_1 [Lachancea nothofagi CBS 11611]|uniref:Signal recognition particle subunit SRP14 n=1 Tax=Lachancea nothofagi CBS 11611 TaxID=1266666 RepID=A0A1G4KIL7_9SACH|nr:LANO_0G09692g1_1 [Lachancea nothofagi CBS 11611]
MTDSKRLTPEEFLKVVPGVFEEANKSKKSVNLSVKRLVERDLIEGNDEFNATELPRFDVSQKAQFTKIPSEANSKQYGVLVRIKKGDGESLIKHSTVVKAEHIDKFWKDYSSAIKSGMVGLIKKKKKKAKKSLRK